MFEHTLIHIHKRVHMANDAIMRFTSRSSDALMVVHNLSATEQ